MTGAIATEPKLEPEPLEIIVNPERAIEPVMEMLGLQEQNSSDGAEIVQE